MAYLQTCSFSVVKVHRGDAGTEVLTGQPLQ